MAKVLLVGSGYMAREYCKVLMHLDCNVVVVGRSAGNVESLRKDYSRFEFFSGGIENYLQTEFDPEIQFAINSLPVELLYDSTLLLINAGIKNILIEKPGALELSHLLQLKAIAIANNTNVSIGYNRRFYSSLIELKKRILLDGGILSVHFEFTEWIHTIDPSCYHQNVLAKWILSNSSHVIDTVFALIQLPKIINCQVGGANSISWHPSGSIFTGSGVSNDDIPFTFHSNWNSAGRWSIEVLTKMGKYYLQPMEKLKYQPKGSVKLEDVDLDYSLDIDFKPGLFIQTQNFLNRKVDDFVTIDHQLSAMGTYNVIGGYK